MKLWLDDVRPAPPGWDHVKTVPDAKEALESGAVVKASLDHDLGLCDACWAEARRMAGEDAHAIRWGNHGLASYASCIHHGTGYDLVCWMEGTGHWPAEKPTVHSANPVGAARMRQAIDRHFAAVEA